ncbi:hypothetical protein Taro_025972 [Colocasia esculenta]|uniref:Transposase MuDR plant domain-containing protein n=1 Tax=Colocasia esculenta TaxID=4460 RepID=A0A843VAR5_COLES|nr:hypothetical protein [Colocasia esculenta]
MTIYISASNVELASEPLGQIAPISEPQGQSAPVSEPQSQHDIYPREVEYQFVDEDFDTPRCHEQLKNDGSMMTIVCAENECNWRVHALRLQDEKTFAIRTICKRNTLVMLLGGLRVGWHPNIRFQLG